MNTTIQKRKFLTYAILNAVSFGIYGVITRSKIAGEIDAICNADGQQPRHSFGKAWILSKAYVLMIVALVGVPLSVAGAIAGGEMVGTGLGILIFLGGLALTAIIAFTQEGLYMPSWWYTQHNRLVLNAHRYKMILNDSAFDTVVWKSLIYVPMNVLSLVGYTLLLGAIGGCIALIGVSAGIAILTLFLGILASMIVLFIKNIINLPFYYTLRSINRFADNMSVSYVGAYEPMGLVDDDNKDNIFSRTINVLNSFGKEKETNDLGGKDNGATMIKPETPKGGGVYMPPVAPNPPVMPEGKIECSAGNNRGYTYSVAAGEELIIGKDPKIANIVISPDYKEVSRRHCGIKYDKARDKYIVTDYSSNGTKVNDARIETGKPVVVSKGSRIALGKGDNVFVVR